MRALAPPTQVGRARPAQVEPGAKDRSPGSTMPSRLHRSARALNHRSLYSVRVFVRMCVRARSVRRLPLPPSCTRYVTMAESNPAIPDKSRSLRKTSVKKRLETEVKRKEPNKSMKDRLSKKARLSKYRRKSANAKERERMKRQNDVFEVLKEILPCDKAKRSDEEKETKVMLKT